MLRIALAQINPTVGDLQANQSKIISYLKKARAGGAELVIFPELALTGYPPEDLLLKKSFILENQRLLGGIKQFSSGLTVLVGFVESKKGVIYNSGAVIHNKRIQDVYRKMVLPNYGVFDEKRYFTPGDTLPVYTFGKQKFAVSICEDIWAERFRNLLKGRNLDFIINIAASPFNRGKVSERERVMSNLARQAKSFVLYCNLVGGQDEIVFDGTSKVFSPRGELAACGRRFAEDLLFFELDKQQRYPPRKIAVKEEAEVFSALTLGLSDYIRKNSFRKVVVGVSGGIDSAVVLSLAVKALGADRVTALIMPSQYTSRGAFDDARKVCENTGVQYRTIEIDQILQTYLKHLKPFFKGRRRGKTEENLQARIRGNLLMAFSNQFGYLVLNTGNKSEFSCGYCTLYGDMVGGFGVLKDVPKTLVYKLARYINALDAKSAIPESIIKRAPSAELKFRQKDTDNLPAYDLLDPILKLYVEDDQPLEVIVRRGFRKNLVKRIIKMVDANEYKRRQAAPGIKITSRAFGKDRRMPVTNKFFQSGRRK